MTPKSLNGFTFDAAVSSDGASVTVVANKDDHEGKRTDVFRFDPDAVNLLADLLKRTCRTAKDRRKAIRKAARAEA